MAEKIQFDRTILGWIAKTPAEAHPSTTPAANYMPPAQGYAVAMVRPGDDLSDLEAAMCEVMPGARVVWIDAPDSGEDPERHLGFINSLLSFAGQPDVSGMELEQIQPTLPERLYPLVDFLVVNHAERLPLASLHALRRYRSMPPTVLISYDTSLFGTLSRDLLLMRNVYFFQSEAGPAY